MPNIDWSKLGDWHLAAHLLGTSATRQSDSKFLSVQFSHTDPTEYILWDLRIQCT